LAHGVNQEQRSEIPKKNKQVVFYSALLVLGLFFFFKKDFELLEVILNITLIVLSIR